MLAAPAHFDVEALTEVLRASWSIDAPSLDYAPLGFGSHHWLTDEHFVTVDDAADNDDLGAALRTARSLRNEAGLDFVIAAIPADDGRLVVRVGDDWVVHVYERLEVVDDTLFGPHDSPEVVDLVHAVHAATPVSGRHANAETFLIWDRDDLDEALADLDAPWDTGPYGDRARVLLAERASEVRRLLDAYDALVTAAPRDGWGITHGEPHRGNVFRTTRGWAMVDWDTVLLGPPARDLWDIDTAPCDPTLRRLYRMQWDLNEIAVYVAGFYDEHRGDANDDRSWDGLVEYADVSGRWPELFA